MYISIPRLFVNHLFVFLIIPKYRVILYLISFLLIHLFVDVFILIYKIIHPHYFWCLIYLRHNIRHRNTEVRMAERNIKYSLNLVLMQENSNQAHHRVEILCCNSIVPLCYRFLHNVPATDGSGNKIYYT